MAFIKTAEEIEKMRKGGKILSHALKAAVLAVRPGVRLFELDAIAEKVMRDAGATPSFKGYRTDDDQTPFPSTVCISVNDEVVHGPGNRDMTLDEGDIVGLDIGCWYEGLCTDMAVTVPVGKTDAESLKLIQATKDSLLAGVKAAQPGGVISDIGKAVEDVIAPHKYGVVRALVGHGVGHAVHEGPNVPNVCDKRLSKIEIEEGMCLAIEPMVNLGDYHVETAEDDWTVITSDGSRAAHFEVTIAITKNGPEILTPLPV